MFEIIGIIVIYSWGHFVFLSFKKMYDKLTTYEKAVMWVAVVSFTLYVMNTINS